MRRERRPLAAINITPLVDVLLILLVVLMLAMPLFVKRLPVELPQTGPTGAPVAVKSLSVALLRNGTLALDGSPAGLETVLSRIAPDTTVELAVDAEVTYETMAKLIAQLNTRSPKEVALITR